MLVYFKSSMTLIRNIQGWRPAYALVKVDA